METIIENDNGNLRNMDENVNLDENLNNQETNENNNEVEDNRGAKRSWVWTHFEYVKGAKSVKCPYCKKKMACDPKKNGTGSLGNHLKHVCRTSPIYKQNQESHKQSLLGFKPIVKGENGGSSLTSYSFSQEKCRKALAKMCIKDNMPFSIVDDEGFQEYSWEMNPMFKIPSRWTITRDCLCIYKEEAERIKLLLKNQTVCLTTDTWSSVQNINYMCLTVHWIDDEWVLRKRILNFCPIANHKGETIGRLVYGCLQQWGIEQVFTVTVDNASSNDGAIKFLKTMLRGPDAILDCKYLHLRCCAHIVNLVVRDGLEEQHLSIAKIRNAVRYVRSSPAREASFKESVERAKIKCDKKVCLDVDTRWNSTFLMLETAEKYDDAFERLHLIDYKYKTYFSGHDEDEHEGNTRKRKRREGSVGPPGAKDWEIARQFIEYLRVFYQVTNLISGSKYVTSNMFFNELVKMHASISTMCMNANAIEKQMDESMKTKYDKYWDNIDNINMLLYVAVVLDPRNKMCFFVYCLREIYGNNAPKIKEIEDRVIQTLKELFEHYKMKAEKAKAKLGNKGPSTSSNATGASNCMDVRVVSTNGDLESNFLKYMKEQGGINNKSEVEIYLSDGMEKREESFDILNWWKMNSLKFPVLSQVARHVLGMPISTVASESAFSTGGRVIDSFRSSLTPKTAEALICAQDWIRSSPADLEKVHDKDTDELQVNLEKIEIDEFSNSLKFFASSLLADGL